MLYPESMDRGTHVDALLYEQALIDEWIATQPQSSATSKAFMRAVQTYLSERVDILTEEAK